MNTKKAEAAYREAFDLPKLGKPSRRTRAFRAEMDRIRVEVIAEFGSINRGWDVYMARIDALRTPAERAASRRHAKQLHAEMATCGYCQTVAHPCAH